MEIMRHVILSFEPTADLRALDEGNMAAAYQTVLDGKRVLLFLDNARSAEQISPLQPPEPCAMLVTSRWIFPVAGLQIRRVDVMSGKYAEEFLIKLCPRIGDQAAELAKACAYLPLALRIAGSFLQVNDHWKIENYIAQLNDHKERLKILRRSREDIELKTEPDLLATFELSYGQLTEETQKSWRALGVFPTFFDANAAGAMWNLEEDGTLKLLGLLMRYSLLDFDETSSRYSLHDLLSEYACSKIEKDDENEARLRHASHYKDVLGAADDLYLKGGENVLLGLHLFDLEWENIRTGHAWAIATHESDPNPSKLCIEYPNAGVYVLNLRQHPREKIRWLEAAISSAREIGDRQGEGVALGNLGNAYAALGDARKAIEYHEQALVIAREIGDRRGEGAALGNLGLAYADLGDARKAIEYYEQRMVIAREIGDRRGEGAALGNLGNAYADIEETEKAILNAEQLTELAKAQEEYRVYLNIGNIYSKVDQEEKAYDAYGAAILIAPEVGMLYRNRASSLIKLKRWQEASNDLIEGEKLEPDHPYLFARKADLAFWQGKFTDAVHWYQQALMKKDYTEWHLDLVMALLGARDNQKAMNEFDLVLNHIVDKEINSYIKALERAKTILPDPTEVENIIMLLQEKLAKSDEADVSDSPSV